MLESTPVQFYTTKWKQKIFPLFILWIIRNVLLVVNPQKYQGSCLQLIYDANRMWQKWQGENPLFADTFFFLGKLVAIWPRSFLNALPEA